MFVEGVIYCLKYFRDTVACGPWTDHVSSPSPIIGNQFMYLLVYLLSWQNWVSTLSTILNVRDRVQLPPFSVKTRPLWTENRDGRHEWTEDFLSVIVVFYSSEGLHRTGYWQTVVIPKLSDVFERSVLKFRKTKRKLVRTTTVVRNLTLRVTKFVI